MRMGLEAVIYFIFASFISNVFGQLDILNNFKNGCLIPRGVDISQTALLQKCISDKNGLSNETACYDELGCFPMTYPWTSTLRPLPSPASPKSINVGLTLYTRSKPSGYNVTLWPEISMNGSNFVASRPKTIFITHGFLNDGKFSWLLDMKDALLKQIDANVFVVDWGKGAKKVNYLKVASNTRIVGAELARFGKFILAEGVNASNLHLIGHSLGSHISAYMAKGLNKNPSIKTGRITALDPAQPGFEGTDSRVRLDKDDAEFVDVIHTDAKPFIPFFGFGMLSQRGHIDFYVNGGSNQPGCIQIDKKNLPKINSIADLTKMPIEVVSKLVGCSHGRAYELFTSSIRNANNCSLWGRKMPKVENIFKLTSLGTLAIADPLVNSVDECEPETCTTIGLNSSFYRGRGAFSVSTKGNPPYCDSNPKTLRILARNLKKKAVGLVNGVTSIFRLPLSIFGKNNITKDGE